MESSKSLEQEGLLLVVGESQSFNGLGSLVSSVLDSLGGVAETSLSILVLEDFVVSVIGLVVDRENVFSVESLLGLRLSFVHSEANTVIGSETLGGSVVESSKVQWVGGERIKSTLGSVWSSNETGRMFSQLP